MAYKVPSLDELQVFIVALFKALFPNRNVGSRFSFYWKLVRVIAGAVTDIHAHVDLAGKDFMPDTTSKSALDRWLKIVGLVRKPATPARKVAAGQVSGTAATPIPISLLLHRSTGQTFQINAATAILAGGTVNVDIVGVSVGSATRLKKGEVLEFASPIAGVSQYVKLTLDLDEDGYDSELDGAALIRLLKALGEPSSGGNQADYVRWALAVTGVSAAYAYPNRAGIGSVDVAALHAGSGSTRYLNSGERAVLLAALQALAPSQLAGTGGALRVLTTVPQQLDVQVLVTPNGEAQYAFDWDDSTVPLVAGWNAATRTMQFQAARPATMKAGDRIVVAGPISDQGGKPVVIESLVSTDSITLQTAPTKRDGTESTPVTNDTVYAGGPLTEIIRDAIIAHMNGDILYAGSKGPIPGAVAAATGISTANLRVLLAGIGTANPANTIGLPKYGGWSGALRRTAISTIGLYTRGVLNINMIQPFGGDGANYEATDYAFPLDAQIGVLEVGRVLVTSALTGTT